MVRIRAPEFPSALPWLNCDRPLSLKALRGQLVLLDFWTYGCINCLHIIPDLQYLEHKYSSHLTVIGIHTAKFDQEQNVDSIQHAIQRYGITHPVLVDHDRTLWDHYAIRAYPTFVLIDPEGYIVSAIAGEGRRQLLDEHIQSLIAEYTAKGRLSETFLQKIDLPQSLSITPLAFPGKVLADAASDTLFIADTGHNRLVLTTLDGTLKATIGTGTAGWQDGTWETAQFFAPQGMAIDTSRKNLYVADAGNHLIRKIDLQQEQVNTLAGTGIQSQFLFPHGGRSNIELNSPWDLSILDQRLYIAMAGSHQIWVFDLSENTVQTFMGTGAEYCVDGFSDQAAFAQPQGITTDGIRLFVADSETSSIRVLSLGNPPDVKTLCGQGALFDFGDRDGIGSEVHLQHCSGLVYAKSYLWIADTYNHKIKQIDPTTRKCQTIAGWDTPGLQDGPGTSAQFSEPSGLAYASDRLYVADTNNHIIRCIHLDSLDVTTLLIPQLCAPNACTPTY